MEDARGPIDRGLVDVHFHVLPGIDDGAHDIAAAIDLVRAAAAAGVAVVAATPHCRADHPGVRPGELAERCAALRERLEEDRSSVEIVAGGEVDLAWSRRAADEELALVSYGQRGTDLLVETPNGALDASFERDLGALRARGYRLLLAHPERSEDLRADRARLERLVDDGVLVQLTARNLLPGGDEQHRFAARLVVDGLAHVLASDAHGAGGHAKPDLLAGMQATRAIVGRRARWMAAEAPAAILAGAELPEPPPVATAGR